MEMDFQMYLKELLFVMQILSCTVTLMDNSKLQLNHVVLSTLTKHVAVHQLMVVLFQIFLLVEQFVQVTLTTSVAPLQDG